MKRQRSGRQTKHEQCRDQLLDVPNVAEYLTISAKTVYRLIQRKELPAVRIGRQSLRVRLSDVTGYIERNCTVQG